jgi:hypothetical protein
MLRPITSASRVPAQRRCSRLGRCALLLHESSGDPDVRHGCFNLWRRIGLLKMCQCCAQVGLGAVERRQTRLFELETQVAGTRGCAWRCSSTRRWARFVLAWIRRASSESVTPTHGGSFVETARTHHRVDRWLLGEMWIWPV